MARTAPPPAVNSRMYRHFAVITVAVTGLLAMFAHGENGEAAQAALAKRQQANVEAKKESHANAGKQGMLAANFKDNRATVGSWGSDTGAGGQAEGVVRDYSGTIERYESKTSHIAGGQSIAMPVTAAGKAKEFVLPAAPPPGMTMEELLEAEKRKRGRKLAEVPQSQTEGEAEEAR